MESKALLQEKITFREVYIFDMEILQNIFSQNNCVKAEGKMLFGIPFLLAEKDNKINSFATLLLNSNNEIVYKIYDDGNLTDKDKTLFEEYISIFMKKKRSANFNNAQQLKHSTDHFVHFFNF
ncbi:hypothetical protein [Flavobacterium johnsoniae]|uniref:hypothetical protein n=1 Tax=Flavobacterium johnsoniae TaxID=986 RepID=UPI003D952BE5